MSICRGNLAFAMSLSNCSPLDFSPTKMANHLLSITCNPLTLHSLPTSDITEHIRFFLDKNKRVSISLISPVYFYPTLMKQWIMGIKWHNFPQTKITKPTRQKTKTTTKKQHQENFSTQNRVRSGKKNKNKQTNKTYQDLSFIILPSNIILQIFKWITEIYLFFPPVWAVLGSRWKISYFYLIPNISHHTAFPF